MYARFADLLRPQKKLLSFLCCPCIYIGMATLTQLIEMAKASSSHIEMTNENLVAEIQRLDSSTIPADRERLAALQAKLLAQNAGLIIKVAHRYNRAKAFTPDEAAEISMAPLIAARKFDPERGVKFCACLPWYVRSALQAEHAFGSGQSQSVYARAKAKLNNMDRFSAEQVARAAETLRSKAVLDSPTIAAQMTDNISAEELFLETTEKSAAETRKERMLTLATEAVTMLTPEQKEVLASLLAPAPHGRDADGLRTSPAIARQLLFKVEYAKTQKRQVFDTIQDYILENDPSLRPPNWQPRQQGVWLPEMQGFLMGLFGTPTADEIVNYRKVARRRMRR